MAMQIEGRRGPRKPARASRPVSRGVDTGRMFGPPSSPVQGPPRPVVPAKPNSGAVVGPKIFGPAATRAPSMPPLSSAPARVPSTGSGSGLGTGSTGGIAAFGGGGFGGGGEMGFAGAPEAPAPPPMSEEDFLAQDAEFNDTRSSAEREYQNLLAQIARQRGEYELDNKNALRNLGWEGNGWDQQDRLTGYGQAFQNQLGDFASRGMLDSSLYGGALNDLNRGFNRQRDDLTSALQQFLQGQETDRTQAEAEKTAAITAAQRQALARMAAQFGGI